eukprot:scaffold1487_cov116-Isochrysis_galbana.AAC.3
MQQPTCSVDLSAALRQRTDPHTGEVLFTLDQVHSQMPVECGSRRQAHQLPVLFAQVRDIVRKAVEERERTLREHYDRILQTKLQGTCSTLSRSPTSVPIHHALALPLSPPT